MFESTKFSAIILALFLTHLTHSIKPKAQSSEFPKCCENGEILSESTQYTCIEDKNKTSFLVVNENVNGVLKHDSFNDTCIEQLNSKVVLFNVTSNKILPYNITPSFTKCCPSNSVYSSKEHKCISKILSVSNYYYNLSSDMHFIHVGLQNCETPVTNHFIDNINNLDYDPASGNVTYEKKVFSFGNYCVDETDEDTNVIRLCHDNFNVCQKKYCIRKCCADGKFFKNTNKCVATYTHGLDFSNISNIKASIDDFAIVHGTKCAKRHLGKNYTYHLDELGNLHLTIKDEVYVYTPEDGQYCIEKIEREKTNGFYFFFCGTEIHKNSTKFVISKILLSISSFFLLATIIVKIILRDTMNLHRKTLFTYCCCLLTTYILLLIVQFNPTLENTPCKTIGFLIEFVFLATLAWLNVMCFDIWRTFGSLCASGPYQRSEDKKRFIWYNLYAWAIPIVWSSLTIIFHFTKSLPDYLTPHLGNHKCLLEKKHSSYILFRIGPMTLIVVCNLILFIRTTYYCFKVKNEISKMMDTSEKKRAFLMDKQKLSMLLKFLIIMGVSFICEVLYITVVLTKHPLLEGIFFGLDIINYLQGVFIFFISVVQKPTLIALRKKFGLQEETQRSTATATSMLMSRISSNERKISTSSSIARL